MKFLSSNLSKEEAVDLAIRIIKSETDFIDPLMLLQQKQNIKSPKSEDFNDAIKEKQNRVRDLY
jgi:hypothetical protein